MKIGDIVKLTHKGRLAVAKVVSRDYCYGKFGWTVDIRKNRVSFTDEQIKEALR